MPRVSFHTLGCKLNFAETSTLARDFELRQFDVVDFGTPADVAVINTCSVTDEADRKCRQVIRRALKANPDAFVIVTGCYAQLQPESIASIPGVDAVLGANEKFRLFQLIDSFSKRERTQVAVSCIDDATDYGPAFSSGERTRAFLKVQDGCDYSCSFCTIPMARGRSRSQTVEATVAQAREIAAMGYQEIVLSGVNIGLYGQEHGTSLLSLVQALDEVKEIERYRISSIEPNLLTNEIIDFVAASRAFQPHFHIPLQSGDDSVLGKMRRRYKTELYADRVAYIKQQMPHACIGVDVIVGFPAETEERFENTYRFLHGLDVSYLHVFTYSERPGTVAVDQLDRMDGKPVSKAERSRRNRMLRILSDKKRHAFYVTHQGETRPVLWEGSEHDGVMHGFTDNYVKVQRPHDAAWEGLIEPVQLGAFAEDGTLVAEDAALAVLLY
jgi:threonylcarbamoyladenosine tRNA methylthiotransferase MtaB